MQRLRLFFLLSFSLLMMGADWPQWLGPRRDGTSPETIAAWKQPPRVLWAKAVGEGRSSPVIADGRVFIHARVKDKNEEEVICFDAASGEKKWSKTYPRKPFSSPFGSGPQATPAVVDGKVYTLGITGILSCLEADSGKMLWQVPLLEQYKASNLRFGTSCSPLVEGGLVLVNIGGKEASIVALDSKDQGKLRWKALDDSASYSSPIATGQGKERQAIFLTGANLVSLRPEDGKVFWKFPLRDLLFESSTTPIRAGDLVLASSITYGSVGLELQKSDSGPAVKQKWKNPDLTSYFATPVPVGRSNIFIVTGSASPFKKPSATLQCIESATGKSLWRKEKVGEYHASLLVTGNGKVLLLSDKGELALVDPSPDGYKELARARVCGPQTWAHPALCNGRLYIRDGARILCLQMAPGERGASAP